MVKLAVFTVALTRRNFHADAPNKLWLTDITEFKLPSEEKAYLSPVIDCYDGLVVAWRIGRRPNAALANGSLEDACGTLSPGQRPVCHSDRGCHYRWPGWIGICEGNGLTRSMSRKGCSPDNSACEGFFGRLKNTLIMGIALSTRVIGENAHEPTRWPIKELPSIPATGLNSKSLASAPTKAGQ